MKELVVFIVYFGEVLPVWLPLTLQSMSVNPRVDFVVIGNAAAPAVLPHNVHFEQITFAAMQQRLSELITPGNKSSVRYDDTFTGHYNKGNDIKPMAAELYPQFAEGHEWWYITVDLNTHHTTLADRDVASTAGRAWSDLDVVFGDLLKCGCGDTRVRHCCCRCCSHCTSAVAAPVAAAVANDCSGGCSGG